MSEADDLRMELDDDFDELGDSCEHGLGFDEDCEDCENDPLGCLFPDKCLMPGIHLESECHTVGMMHDQETARHQRDVCAKGQR